MHGLSSDQQPSSISPLRINLIPGLASAACCSYSVFMTLMMDDSAFYYLSLGFIGTTTLFLSIPILTVILTGCSLHNRGRPTWGFWLLAHRLQNVLAFVDLCEIFFLLSFLAVWDDRLRFCRTRLDEIGCHRIVKTWKPVAAVLTAFSTIIGLCLYPLYFQHKLRLECEHHRCQEVLRNRPWFLFIAHLFLQTSAVATVTISYSSFFYADSNARGALRSALGTGAVAIFLLVLRFFTFSGVTRYHLAMQRIRYEAARREQSQVTKLKWLRTVTPAMKGQLFLVIESMCNNYWTGERERARQGNLRGYQ